MSLPRAHARAAAPFVPVALAPVSHPHHLLSSCTLFPAFPASLQVADSKLAQGGGQQAAKAERVASAMRKTVGARIFLNQ